MKKIIALCLLIVATSVSAFAFNSKPQDKKPDPAKRFEQLVKELKLDEKQTKEFKKINDDFIAKLKKERESTSSDREKKRENMKAMTDERDKQIKKVLTEEQYKQYKDKEQKQRERRQGQKQGQGQKRK